MTRAGLLALAERVERAEGADRKLDAEIVWRTTPGIVGIERGPLDDDGLDYLFEWWPRRPWSASWLTVPTYTASLDAAASLVPSRWTRMILSTPGYIAGFLVGDVVCGLHKDVSGGGGPMVYGIASGENAEARTRTAAALRARAQEAGDE
jgi:hypothetical protein